VATARELAVSFLYDQLGWVAAFRDDRPDEVWPERDGRVAGTLGALRAVGLLGANEAEAWRPRLMGAGVERPAPSDAARRAAGELLNDLLEAVLEDDEGRDEFRRFKGALHALQAVGAASDDWHDRLARRMGWPTADEVSERNEGGTERDLRAVLPGPDEALEGVWVLCVLRFADGVSALLRVEDGDDPCGDDLFDVELVDDVGTSYPSSGGGGGGREMKISYSTPVAAGASWLELHRASSRPIRIPL
jgi:hypothetical protein